MDKQEIRDAIAEGELRLAMRQEEAEQAAEQRLQEELAHIASRWKPVVATIEDTTPVWAHEFITWPTGCKPEQWDSYEKTSKYLPATICIPDVATVFAFVDETKVEFRPARYVVSSDDETWSVIQLGNAPLSHWEFSGNNDFLVALALAAQEHERIPELQAEADRRNAEKTANAPAQVDEQEPGNVERWIEKAISNARRTDDFGTSAIAYAVLAVVEMLRLQWTEQRADVERAELRAIWGA